MTQRANGGHAQVGIPRDGFDDALVADVKTALAALKDELQKVRASLEANRRATSLAGNGERSVRETLDGFRSMAWRPARPDGSTGAPPRSRA